MPKTQKIKSFFIFTLLIFPLFAFGHKEKDNRKYACNQRHCNVQDYHYATQCDCCDTKGHRCWLRCRPSCYHPESQCAFDRGLCGVWLPEDPPLFRPFIADPRQLTFSLGHRYNDDAMPKNVIPVSYWDEFPIYRWFGRKPFGGMLQVGIDGALWAIFDPDTYSAPLINADYYGGFIATYAWCNWSCRLRFFHISSHIGDEYLLNHPDFDRRNPSAETLDFFVSNDLTNEFRVYAGAGWVVNCDESYPVGRWLVEAGVEVRIPRLGFWDRRHNICGRPIYAMHYRFKDEFKRHIDATYALGYEITKCCGSRKRWRMFIEYHDGYCIDGQFSKHPSNYFSFHLTYGY